MLYKQIYSTLIGFTFTALSIAQSRTDAFLQNILQRNQHHVFQQVLQDPVKYRCQIIYTQIDRSNQKKPSFKNYFFNYDPELYFNPASMVKMPLAFLSLEKLNTQHIKGVNKFTPLFFDSSYTGQVSLSTDSSAANGLPSIAQMIKRAFLISENDPYNRMYQYVGQGNINRILHEKGYTDAKITRQFMGFTEDQNRHTNAIRFIDKNRRTIFEQAAAYNTEPFDFSNPVFIGKGHFDQKDSLINGPFDFTRHNRISLGSLQQMLQSVVFPESVPEKQRFKLNKTDRQFLLKYLSQYPSETSYPYYDTSVYYDSYVKLFFKDGSHQIAPNIRVFNKVGWAYGFLTDVSYITDTKNNIDFMLAATIYVNSDEIVNDSKYDYDSIGYPFMYQLGQTIYQYELLRKRVNKPMLNNLKIHYDQRKQKMARKTISVADN